MDQTPRLTVCGAGAAGLAIAADSALKGIEVKLFELPAFAAKLDAARAAGGIEVTADSETTAGKTGFAPLVSATDDPAEAVAGADVVMITAPAMYHDVFTDALAPHLREGQIVLYNTGYWASLRQSLRLGDTVPDVTWAESNIMPYICQPRGDAINIGRFKRHFCVAAFPGERSAATYDVLRRIYAQYDPAETVLDTNIAAAGNPPIHVTLTIPIAGLYFDRYMGGKFYQDTTIPGARLVSAFDAERERLAAHLGSESFEDQVSFDRRSYLYEGEDLVQMLRSSPHADWFATAAYLEQVGSEDIIYAFVPMVRLGEALGIDLPVTRAMVEVMGVMLQRDYWAEGLDLADIGLDGLDLEGVRRFVVTGRR
jgi:opine dehydrogenase